MGSQELTGVAGSWREPRRGADNRRAERGGWLEGAPAHNVDASPQDARAGMC
jgi:hypothetical protein